MCAPAQTVATKVATPKTIAENRDIEVHDEQGLKMRSPWESVFVHKVAVAAVYVRPSYIWCRVACLLGSGSRICVAL